MKIKKYSEMSLTELKNEYNKYYGDRYKRIIIKKIIDSKIELEKINKEQKSKMYNSIQNSIQENEKNMINSLLEELVEEIDENDNNILNKSMSRMEPTNINPLDIKYEEEVRKDITNNKLMERLNSELIFRKNINTIEKKMEKPYFSGQNVYSTYNSNNQVASLNDGEAFGLSNMDFTSEGILKKKRILKN